MPKGLALCAGLNAVDPARYAGWSGLLNACESDARDMAALAEGRGYETTLLLTAEARRDPVLGWMREAARRLSRGDIFLIFYSGHGGQVRDIDGDEVDNEDETWCLFDGQAIDDELYEIYGSFAAGVRGLVLSDSCHSGTVLKSLALRANLEMASLARIGTESTYKAMPPEVARKAYQQNKKFYDGVQTGTARRKEREPPKATIRLLSGCQDNQFSRDGTFNSAFTAALLKVWANGKFAGDYGSFTRAIQAELPETQSPNHMTIGPEAPAFDKQIPFTI